MSATRRYQARRRTTAPKVPSIMDPSLRDPGGVLARCDARRELLPTVPRAGEPAIVEARFRFALPAPVASINAVDGWHWAERAAHRSLWREAARNAADAAADFLAPFAGYRVQIQVAFPVRDPGRRRDPSNFIATLKPLLDGITDAGVLWPDDNATWVELRDCVFWKGEDVVVRVAAAPPVWDPSADA